MNKPKSQFELECQAKGKIKTCLECGKEFISNRSLQKYCSLECQKKKYIEMAKFRKECGIIGLSKIEFERLKEKAKREKLTILD
jgi:hypothetical protein